MERNNLERLLREWDELAASTLKALEVVGDPDIRWSEWPYDALCTALVAEIVGGTADPKPTQFSRVISPDGKLIQVERVTSDGTGLIAKVLPLSMVQRSCDEVAVVATAGLRPVAVHFLDVRFLEPLAHALGLTQTSPYSAGTSVAFGRLMHLALAADPAVAAVWGTRTIWLRDHVTEATSGLDLAPRLRLEYNRGDDLSEHAQRVVDRVICLEHDGEFKWMELKAPYNNMAATLTDAVLAFRDHPYEPFTSTRVATVLREYPDLATTSDLLAVLEEGDRFWSLTRWPAQERAYLMREVAMRFQALGLETEEDLLTLRGSRAVAELEMLSPRERSYLLLVSGSKERSSASNPIREFLENSGVELAMMLDDFEVEATMIEAASALGRPTSTLDHSVWRSSLSHVEQC